MVDPLHHLLGAIRLLADLREEVTQTLAVEVEQVDLAASGGRIGGKLYHLVHGMPQRGKTSVSAKKYAISTLAVSTASEPCTAFASIDSAKSARIVPGLASFGLVAPIRSRCASTAFSPCSTLIITGPEIMNSTSALKNGRSLCTA